MGPLPKERYRFVIEGPPPWPYLRTFRDMFAKVRDVVGGRVGSYEKVFAEAKQEALKDLEEKAKALGADAVVGIDLDYEILGADEKTMLHVSANGTAVKLG